MTENSHFNQYLNTFLNHQPFLSHHQLAATSSSCPSQTNFINLFPAAPPSSFPSVSSPAPQYAACNLPNFGNNTNNNLYIKKNNENHFPINQFSNEHLQTSISNLFNNNSLGLQVMNRMTNNDNKTRQNQQQIYHITTIPASMSTAGSDLDPKSFGFNLTDQNV